MPADKIYKVHASQMVARKVKFPQSDGCPSQEVMRNAVHLVIVQHNKQWHRGLESLKHISWQGFNVIVT